MKIDSKHFLSAFIIVFFVFIAFGSLDDKSSENKSTGNSNETSVEPNTYDNKPSEQKKSPNVEIENKYLINDGTYEGHTTCTCCGATANQPGNDYGFEVRNISKNKISFNYLEYQNRDIIGYVKNGKIIIDERKLELTGLVFWGTVEIIDKNTITINIKWTDVSRPDYDGSPINKCTGTFQHN